MDIGHGYTSDGQGFPLRGIGVGLMPRLEDVFVAFPEGRFLINFKSNRGSEGKVLVALLEARPAFRPLVFGVYGGQEPTRRVAKAAPDIRAFDPQGVRSCLLCYAALGWSGVVPRACQNTFVIVPVSHARLLWGWPYRFQRRMARVGTDVIIVGPYGGGRRIDGVDTRRDLARVPEGFAGYVWTNDISVIMQMP